MTGFRSVTGACSPACLVTLESKANAYGQLVIPSVVGASVIALLALFVVGYVWRHRDDSENETLQNLDGFDEDLFDEDLFDEDLFDGLSENDTCVESITESEQSERKYGARESVKKLGVLKENATPLSVARAVRTSCGLNTRSWGVLRLDLHPVTSLDGN
nr:hypothetical protein BaRGS_000707 [Batillaria attramentaria]